jgi:hypothetical protein
VPFIVAQSSNDLLTGRLPLCTPSRFGARTL